MDHFLDARTEIREKCSFYFLGKLTTPQFSSVIFQPFMNRQILTLCWDIKKVRVSNAVQFRLVWLAWMLLTAVLSDQRGGGNGAAPTDYGRPRGLFKTGGQFTPSTLLLAPPPWILRPSWGPAEWHAAGQVVGTLMIDSYLQHSTEW